MLEVPAVARLCRPLRSSRILRVEKCGCPDAAASKMNDMTLSDHAEN